MGDDFRVAVKTFIVDDEDRVLIIKRRLDDCHYPGIYEIPGGRLELGENIFTGAKRETKEETGLDIEILYPLDVHHFTRQDNQEITSISFLCRALSRDVELSEEHIDHSWEPVNTCRDKLHKLYHKEVDNYIAFFQGRF